MGKKCLSSRNEQGKLQDDGGQIKDRNSQNHRMHWVGRELKIILFQPHGHGLNMQKKPQHNHKNTRYSGDLQLSLKWQIRESWVWCQLLKPVSSWSFWICGYAVPPVVSVSFKPHNLCLFFHKLFFFAWSLPWIWNRCGYMGRISSGSGPKSCSLMFPKNKRGMMSVFQGGAGKVLLWKDDRWEFGCAHLKEK